MKKVTYIRLHTAGFVKDIGSIGDVLPGNKTLSNLEMYAATEGVEIKFYYEPARKHKHILVPYGNLQSVEFEVESENEKISSKPRR